MKDFDDLPQEMVSRILARLIAANPGGFQRRGGASTASVARSSEECDTR
jgi:hypothetical protein